MSAISPYRVTPDDLPDLDGKTRDALAPLLDSLNITLAQLVQALAAQPSETPLSSTFTSGASGTAYVDLRPTFPRTPRSLVVDQLRLSDDTPVLTVWSFTWTVTQSGIVRALFVGLAAEAKYNLAVTIK